MEPQYNHQKYESDIYKMWESSGAFTPQVPSPRDKRQAMSNKLAKPFTIIMPPPNANDPLHIGHARFVAIEDILVRYHRMKGEPTLWLPGSDHAGIETQFVFEKKLKEQGKSRFDYDRETLYEMILDYVLKNTGIMHNQLKQLGASCDWTRHKFTLDPDIIKIVYKTFKHLHDDGLIYRGKRIVNYCPRCGTNYSELEVDHIERDDYLYYIKYEITPEEKVSAQMENGKWKMENIVVATTRPETIFADVAIAVNPKDKRYTKLIGKTAHIPLINREIPIIADPLVEMEFGTGSLKITPGHDATDFEIGQKHKLATISVIDEKGRMTSVPQKYSGMKINEAREEVVKDLEEQGLLVKKETLHHSVGVCYRCKSVIEPTISEQWFISVKPLTEKSLKAIKDKKIKFNSKRYEKMTVHWLKNLRDWNISRQIVWGIRIPAYRCEKCLEWSITNGAPPDMCSHCNNQTFRQDEDTFDTWFSSGQWPFVTLKTANPEDFNHFYPTSVMNTAYDILPFWIVRMIMLGMYETKNIPFQNVVVHGLVRDKHGVKISKSKGNVINPIEMAEKYGADALRMGITWGALVENDIALSEDNIRAQRNFSNKLWNVARFIYMDSSDKPLAISHKPRAKHTDDTAIMSDLSKTIKIVTKHLDKYRLNEAAEEVYNFIWKNFANDYLEKVKNRRTDAQPILEYVLQESLKLAHPFMPFVTESIWQEGRKTNRYDNELLITASWPK
jgi:valyl-tRNA synthetase